jgi:hypothetical protein
MVESKDTFCDTGDEVMKYDSSLFGSRSHQSPRGLHDQSGEETTSKEP